MSNFYVGSRLTLLLVLAGAAQAEETIRFEGHARTVTGVAFTPDGRVVSCSGDGIRVWDPATRKQVAHHAGADGLNALAVSPDGKLAAVARRHRVLLVDLATGKTTKKLEAHKKRLGILAFSADGKRLASAGRSGRVRLWSIPEGKLLHTLEGHTENVLALGFRPDNKQLASGDSGGVVRFWDVAGGTALHTLKAHKWFVGALAWSPDGKRLATVSKTRKTKVFEVPEKQLFEWDGGTKLYAVAYSPDGSKLASGGRQGWVQLLDPATGKPGQRLEPKYEDDNKGLVGIAWSHDGRWLASAHFDGRVRLWKVD